MVQNERETHSTEESSPEEIKARTEVTSGSLHFIRVCSFMPVIAALGGLQKETELDAGPGYKQDSI